MQNKLEKFVKKLDENLTVEAMDDLLANIESFPASGNIFDTNFAKLPEKMQNLVFQYMRKKAELQMVEVFKTLKFDLRDPNISNKESIGTPARFIKTITGKTLEDDSEMMCGRYSKAPKLARFPNEDGSNTPITKRVDISSVCSHHLLPYGTQLGKDAYAVVSYVPNKFVLGISKLQRYVDWVSRRPTIQEGLTKNLHDAIKSITESDSVYVGIFNAVHTCEKLRGSRSKDGSFTTEFYSGIYNNMAVRTQILQSIK